MSVEDVAPLVMRSSTPDGGWEADDILHAITYENARQILAFARLDRSSTIKTQSIARK